MVKAITSKEEFDQVMANNSSKLIVIDFYATWCGPCKMIAPKLNKMEEEFKECLFLKVDVDEALCEELIDDYQVKVMPTFVLFKNGQKVAQLEGNVPDQLREEVLKHK